MTDEPTQSGGVAAEVAKVDEAVMQFLPFIGTLTAVIPGAQVVTPWMPAIGALLGAVDTAAKAVAGGKPAGTEMGDIFKELMDHLTPGAPNSPILS